MPTEVDDELKKYAAKPASDDDELEKYAHKPAVSEAGSLEDYLGKQYVPGGAEESQRDELPGASPRLRKAVESGKAPKPELTDFEKQRPGEGISLKGAGSAFWDKLKSMAPEGPDTSSVSGFLFGHPSINPSEGGLAQAGGEAAHEYERARKAGSGIIPSIGTAGVVGAGSFLGVSNKAEEEQAERGEGGKIIGEAAAPAAVAAAAPFVGPAVEAAGRGLHAGVIRPITDALADRFTTPAVAPGIKGPALANLQEPLARRGVEKVLRSSGMPSGQPGLREAFSLAAPDLAEIERKQPLGESGKQGGISRPDMRLRQTVENIDNRLDDIWKKERQPQIDRNAELPALSREQLLGDATIDQLKRIEKTFKMDIPEQINLGDADKMLVKVNARLRRAEGMTPEARALALELSPDLQKFNEMKGELHKSIGDLLERVNEPGIKEFNRRYGALSEVRDALRNKMNPVEAERVLDSVRATGGLGRNVNLFERLHLKASPGRLAQKGLEDLSRSNLEITPPTPRPPTAGLLPPIPEPLGNGPDTSGPVKLTVPEGQPVVPVPGGRFVRGLLPGPVPPEGPVAPPSVPGQFRIEPIGAPTDEGRVGMRGEQGTRTPAPKGLLPEVAGAVPVPKIPFKGPLDVNAPTKPIMEGAAKIPEIGKVTPTVTPEAQQAASLREIKPKLDKTAKKKIQPVAERLSHEDIANAEGLLASEAGAMATGDRPGAYFDEVSQTDQPLTAFGRRNTKGARAGGTWRGVKSGRSMYPFMRENPDVNPQAVLKALRNKDSAAYNKLITRADDFLKGNYAKAPGMGAMDFLKSLDNPDAEPETIEPGADVFNPPEEEATPAPRIPEIAKGQTGIIPGMEENVAKQREGAAKVSGENLTAEANKPKDISAAAGRMETLSPLFRGTEASPQREIFGNAPPAANEPPATIAPVIKEAGWDYEGRNALGQYTIRMPGTDVRIHLFERQLEPEFIRRQILAKEKQYGTPKEKGGKGAVNF